MNLRTIITIAAIGFGASMAQADTMRDLAQEGYLCRECNYMGARISIDLGNLSIPSDKALVIEPTIVNGQDSVRLTPIGIYGRRRYIYYMRNMGEPITGSSEIVMEIKDAPDVYTYEQTVDYQDWMNGSTLHLNYYTYGCCNTQLSAHQQSLAYYEEFTPAFIYASPRADASKVCQLSGSAYIDFPVNKTVIYPDYRRNTVELSKIRNTIDSVRGDSDYTITEVWLKGYASPESPYAHNSDLAQGRVAALKAHIGSLYYFGEGVITTAFEPEDWEGLKRFIATEGAVLANAAEIRQIAEDESIAPDEKEHLFKTRYPADYKYMLNNWFPALRHTDYRITYEVRRFYDPHEIAKVMATSPQKLSLNELYVLSNEYEPGSEEFNEVFETAVRMFPSDPTANFNAALNAMQRQNLASAESYLSKAGTSAQVDYAKGLLAAFKQEYEEGMDYLQKAADAGLSEAQAALDNLRRHLNIE